MTIGSGASHPTRADSVYMKTRNVSKMALITGAVLLGGLLSGCTAYVDEPVARTTTYRTTETTVAPPAVEATRVTTTRTY